MTRGTRCRSGCWSWRVPGGYDLGEDQQGHRGAAGVPGQGRARRRGDPDRRDAAAVRDRRRRQVGAAVHRFRDNFAVRFGLRTSSWQVSRDVPRRRAPTARAWTLDAAAAVQGRRDPARRLRRLADRADLPGGRAGRRADPDRRPGAARAGRDAEPGWRPGESDRRRRDVLADVLAVIRASAGLHWQTLAGRLAKRFPERHASARPSR